MTGEEAESFRLLEDPNFLLYLDLQQPSWRWLPFVLDPDIAEFSNPRPVLINGLTDEVLFGPESCSFYSGQAYGSAKLLARLNRESRRWQELGSPQLSDYLFTAVPLAHHNHTQAQHLPLSVPGELYYLPPPDGGYLDWVIRLVK
jgi:hypothetical protein